MRALATRIRVLITTFVVMLVLALAVGFVLSGTSAAGNSFDGYNGGGGPGSNAGCPGQQPPPPPSGGCK
jgi:hypothetical protein